MKNSCDNSLQKFIGAFILMFFAVGSAYSGVVFEAGFRGPGDGNGGAYDMVAIGGTGKMENGYPANFLMSVTGDDPLDDSGGYMQCEMIDVDTSYTRNISFFTPDSAASSLDAMSDVVGGDRVLNGGFDFFFRSNSKITGGEMRALDSSNTGNGGLRFVFTSQSPGLRLEMIANSGGFLSGGEGGSSVNSVIPYGAFTIESNTVYHFGVTFETDTEGTVTAKIWGQEGSGAIDLTEAQPVASAEFGIDENIVTSGFSTGNFSLGQIRSYNIDTPMTHVYDQFRIYDETPTSFGALEDVSPSWRDSSPETVLRADFNGPGNGTGGDNDIVTLGGTATLVDAGIYSDASVFESDPFKTSGINESVVTDGLTTGSFNFGKILGYGEVPSVQDFDCLRVYKDTPLVLSALPVPTSGTIILVQ